MDGSKLSNSQDENEGDYTQNMIDRSSDYDEENQEFVENSSYMRGDKSHSKKHRTRKPNSKDSESQTTFMVNIQTTADLISYVKRRQNKRITKGRGGRGVPSKRGTSTGLNVGRLGNGRRDGIAMGHNMRHFGLYQQQQNSRTIDIQTDDLDILDLRVTEVNLAEVYHFDKVSSCLKKIVIETGVDAQIYRQFEYIHKDTIRNKYKSRPSMMGRMGRHLSKQDQFKRNIGEVVSKGEVHRLNDAIKALINKVKDYEHENAYLEEKRSCISSEFPLFKESENDVFNRGWRKGYSAGYSRGNSNGFFKGSVESQYIGHQKGIEEGMQEGWNFGFDEGFKTGIRKVFRDAREAGIDLSSLELMEYISQEDKIKGLMKNLYNKLTKVFAISDRLDAANKLHEKFVGYSDKRKKLAVKVGRKNIVKNTTQFFLSKINSNTNQLLNEFLYDECIKKYGNSKLADKKLIQIFAGAVYHQNNERVSSFCKALHLSNKRNYSHDILVLYLHMLNKFHKEYNTRINAIKDESADGETDFGPFFKAVEIFKEIFEEKIPLNTYTKLKQQVDKMLVSKATMKIIDVDKFLTFVISNYMKHYINFNSPSEIIYTAWTLYERNAMTMNELYVTTELIKPVNIMVDIPEEGKQTPISKDQFYSLFTTHLKGRPEEHIYSFQYKEVMDNVDVFSVRRVKKLLDLTPYSNSLNDFKQEFNEVSTIIKNKLNEVYKGKKWKQLNRIDDKSLWLQRLHAIQKSIGVVNTTILKISLTLVKESVDFFYLQKLELLGGKDEDENEDDDEEGEDGEEELSEKPKGAKRVESRNDMKASLDGNSTERASNDQKSVMLSQRKGNRGTSKALIPAGRKISSVEDQGMTPRSKVSAPDFKEGGKRKSLTTQKTLFGGSHRKMRKFASKM